MTGADFSFLTGDNAARVSAPRVVIGISVVRESAVRPARELPEMQVQPRKSKSRAEIRGRATSLDIGGSATRKAALPCPATGCNEGTRTQTPWPHAMGCAFLRTRP